MGGEFDQFIVLFPPLSPRSRTYGTEGARILEGELQTPRPNQRAFAISCRVERFPKTIGRNASLLTSEGTRLR